jgi:hypothetical protein
MLEELFPPHDVEMAFDFRVFFGEAVNFFLGEVAAESGVEFAGEL